MSGGRGRACSAGDAVHFLHIVSAELFVLIDREDTHTGLRKRMARSLADYLPGAGAPRLLCRRVEGGAGSPECRCGCCVLL